MTFKLRYREGAATPLTRWVLLVLVCVGLAARLGVAVALDGGLNEGPKPGSDDFEYDSYAWNVAQGRGYRGISPDVTDPEHLTAYRPPGTSLAWAGVYRLFGHRYAGVRVLHGIVGAATILLVYWIGQRCFGRSVGLLAAGAYTVWPTSLLYSSALMSEPLGSFWLMGYVAVSLLFAGRPSGSRALWAGLLLGLAILTRPNAGLMVPLAGLWAAYQFRGRPRILLLALAIPIVSLLTLAPWAYRNYVVFDAFIPLSTGGGDVFLGANNSIVATDPIYYGYWIWPGEIAEYRNALRPLNNEIERDRLARKLALSWLKENRDKWWYLAHSRVRRAWTPVLLPRSPKFYRLAMLLSWTPVLTLMLVSFFPTLIDFLRKRHPGWLLHLVIVHVAAGSIVFWGSSRFRYPIEGLCIILTCAALVWVYRLLFGKRLTVPTMST